MNLSVRKVIIKINNEIVQKYGTVFFKVVIAQNKFKKRDFLNNKGGT